MNASTVPILDFFMATDIAAAVNAVILLMVVVSVTIVVRALPRLKRETSAAKERMRLAGEPVSVGDIDQATLIGQRIALLRTLPRDAIPASLERLGAADAEQLQQQVGVARWCVTAMILLGLAGTLIGLSIGLAPLASVLGNTSPGLEAFWAAMTESVSGMRTAFSTTLAGVTGAIAVGALLALYERRQGSLLIELERASLATLPALLSTEEARLNEVVESLNLVRAQYEQSFEELLAALDERGRDLIEEVTRGFDDSSHELVRGFQRLVVPFEELRDTTLRIIGQREGEASLADQVARLKEAATATERGVVAASELVVGLGDRLEEAVDRQGQTMGEILERHYGEMAEQLQQQAESTRQLSEEVRRATDGVAEVADSFDDFGSAVEKQEDAWLKAIKLIEDAQGLIDARFANLGSAVEESMKKIVDAHQGERQRLLNQLARLDERLSDSIGEIDTGRRLAETRSEDLLKETQQTLRSAIERMEASASNHSSELAHGIGMSIDRLGDELREWTLALGGAMADGANLSGRRMLPEDFSDGASSSGTGLDPDSSSASLPPDDPHADYSEENE